jgi:hypothetical protein
MAINTRSNAFDSPIVSLFFKNSKDERYSFDILSSDPKKNAECKFIRLEMEETVFTIYPVGALVVRDTGDIINFIQNNKIDSILVSFNDGAKPRLLSITSTASVTNAASDNEDNFVSINFTNSFYKLSQQTAAADLLITALTLEDRVYTIEELFKAASTNIKTKIRSTQDTHIGTLTPADNFFSLKQLNIGNNKLNLSVTDNAFQYLNYLSSLAVDKITREPRFMFWTEFGDYINFKHFPSDLTTDTIATGNYNTKNYRYSIYNGDSPTQKAANGKTYKKIYVLLTDPTNQWVSKNYFYVRKTPKFLDTVPAGMCAASYTTQALTFHFQDDGEKYNIETIASNGLSAGVTSGADEVFYDKDYGWISDINTVNNNAPATHGSGEFGLAKTYSNTNYMGHSGYFSRADNTEMWKNIFDMTAVHPDYPRIPVPGAVPNTTGFYYNEIQKNLTELYKGSSYSPANLETRRKIERENFVMYVLCCLGNDDSSFFARLTKYEPDKLVADYQEEDSPGQTVGPVLKWRYKWQGLQFNNSAGSTYWSLMELWTGDDTNMAGATQDTWAINLNERTAGGIDTYLPPGWVAEVNGFKYRPIGCNTPTVNPAGAAIDHIVKMYRISAEKISMDGNITVPPELKGKVMYYFIAENVLDGTC